MKEHVKKESGGKLHNYDLMRLGEIKARGLPWDMLDYKREYWNIESP